MSEPFIGSLDGIRLGEYPVRDSRAGELIGAVRFMRHRDWRGVCGVCHVKVSGSTKIAAARRLAAHNQDHLR